MDTYSKGGRPPIPKEQKAVKFSSSLPPGLYARLEEYCQKEERDKAYAIRKALEDWLTKQGY